MGKARMAAGGGISLKKKLSAIALEDIPKATKCYRLGSYSDKDTSEQITYSTSGGVSGERNYEYVKIVAVTEDLFGIFIDAYVCMYRKSTDKVTDRVLLSTGTTTSASYCVLVRLTDTSFAACYSIGKYLIVHEVVLDETNFTVSVNKYQSKYISDLTADSSNSYNTLIELDGTIYWAFANSGAASYYYLCETDSIDSLLTFKYKLNYNNADQQDRFSYKLLFTCVDKSTNTFAFCRPLNNGSSKLITIRYTLDEETGIYQGAILATVTVSGLPEHTIGQYNSGEASDNGIFICSAGYDVNSSSGSTFYHVCKYNKESEKCEFLKYYDNADIRNPSLFYYYGGYCSRLCLHIGNNRFMLSIDDGAISSTTSAGDNYRAKGMRYREVIVSEDGSLTETYAGICKITASYTYRYILDMCRTPLGSLAIMLSGENTGVIKCQDAAITKKYPMIIVLNSDDLKDHVANKSTYVEEGYLKDADSSYVNIDYILLNNKDTAANAEQKFYDIN